MSKIKMLFSTMIPYDNSKLLHTERFRLVNYLPKQMGRAFILMEIYYQKNSKNTLYISKNSDTKNAKYCRYSPGPSEESKLQKFF